MRAMSVVLMLVVARAALAQDGGVPLRARVPTDAECLALGPLAMPLAAVPGEVLEYDLDALGAKAGKMTMSTLFPKGSASTVFEIQATTNTFFSKVRRVKAVARSTVNPRTLRPTHYLEDALENEVHRVADVSFRADHTATLVASQDAMSSTYPLSWGKNADGLDVAGAVYVMRQLPLKEGRTVCFDVYGIRRMWRVWGRVLPREHVSMPVGEFEAWHLKGEAVRLDWLDGPRREVHIWVTDDARRLPLAALGSIDLGAVRATLTSYTRPGEKQAKAENKANLKW